MLPVLFYGAESSILMAQVKKKLDFFISSNNGAGEEYCGSHKQPESRTRCLLFKKLKNCDISNIFWNLVREGDGLEKLINKGKMERTEARGTPKR